MTSAFPIPGRRCWAVDCAGYHLPPGLAARSPLTILEWREFTGQVRDSSGQLWDLMRTQIDTGYTFFLDGEDCHESHPRCAHCLRHKAREIEKILTMSLEDLNRPVLRFTHEDNLSMVRWYLERNGYDPDVIPSGPPPRASCNPNPGKAANPRLPPRHDDSRPRRMNS